MKRHTQMIFIAFLMSFIFVSLSLADDPLSTGKEALQKGDVQKAISALREAVKNDKKNTEPYFWLGTALLKTDSVDQAVRVLYQARELDSANAKIYSLLGDAYSQQKIFAAAIPPYQKAIELDSANSTYYVKLGQAYMKARQYSDAARAFKRVLSLDTSNVDINRELANLYVRSKPPQYAMAAPLLDRLMKLRPDSLNFQIQLVAALFHTNNFEKLIPVAQGVLQRDSNQTEVLRALSVAYVKARDNDNAVKILLQLEQRGMLKVEDYIELAKAQKALERFDDAIESYEKAYRLIRQTVKFIMTLVRCI